jgi:hypothetical protein
MSHVMCAGWSVLMCGAVLIPPPSTANGSGLGLGLATIAYVLGLYICLHQHGGNDAGAG